jgi:hypothetical protein
MRHPFEAIPAGKRLSVFLPLLVLTLLLMVMMSRIGNPLITKAAPSGIVSFELAGSVPGAQRIIESWDDRARLYAAFSLGLDFLYLVAYSTTIGLACVWATSVIRSHDWPLAGAGILLAWGQWVAALLDAVENIALLTVLLGPVVEPWPAIALGCAVPKFALVIIGLLYAALTCVAQAIDRFSRR